MRRLCMLVVGLAGCASGDEPATMPTGFVSGSASASAGASASGSASTSGTDSDGDASADSDDSDDSDDPMPDDPSGTSGAGESSGSGSSGPGSTGEGSSGGASEQPEDGMYSACDSVVDCIGLTACLTAMDTSGEPIDAFCTAGSCKSPLAQCEPTPGGTAVPSCLEVDLGGVMDSVCALDCSQGQECPAGMECRTLTAGSICS